MERQGAAQRLKGDAMSFLDGILNGTAYKLKTLSGVVDVSGAAAPVPGQVLTALDATHAQWSDPTGGGDGGAATALAFTDRDVSISGSSGENGDVLTIVGGDLQLATPTGGGAADALATTGGPVDVSGAAPPTSGQILTADDETAAEWVDPSWLSLDFFDSANTVIAALDGDGGLGPAAVLMPPSTVLMRADTGDIFAGNAADLAALIGPVSGTDSVARDAAAAAQATADAAVPAALFDANTVLVADVDNTPHALAAPASTVMTRLATGAIKWGSIAELQALLSISVSGGGAITQFSWASNAASLALTTSKNWATTNTLTGNSTLTLTGGVEGDYGTIYVKQDGTGGRTLTFTVSGRTIIRDTNSIDDNPQSTNSAITAYNYQFVTINGTPCIRLTKVFLA
jgi:hypothetical protein